MRSALARILALAVLLASGSAAVGCGSKEEGGRPTDKASNTRDGGAKAGPAGPDTNQKTWEQMVALMERVADIADEHEDDCDAIAREIDALLHRKANADLLARAKATKKSPTQDVAMQEKYQPRIMEAMDKLMPAMEKCKDHPALKKAMEKLD